jgi:hypothetical protein
MDLFVAGLTVAAALVGLLANSIQIANALQLGSSKKISTLNSVLAHLSPLAFSKKALFHEFVAG